MRLRLLGGLLDAAAVYHRDPELKRQLRRVAAELSELDATPPSRPRAHSATRRKSA